MNAAGCACSARSMSRGAGQVHPPLQPLKPGRTAALVEGDDLAVEHQSGLVELSSACLRAPARSPGTGRLLVAVARPEARRRALRAGTTRRARGCRRTSARRPAPCSGVGQRRFGQRGQHRARGATRDRTIAPRIELSSSGDALPPQIVRPGVRLRSAGAARARGVVAPRRRHRRCAICAATFPRPPIRR